MAISGESSPLAASWSEIDQDSRLRLPTDITSKIQWYAPGQRCEILIELREKGSILFHSGERRLELQEKRTTLQETLADKTEALRRTALSLANFVGASVGKTNRRVTLPSDVLYHLGAKKFSRVLCLAYADIIEVLGESRAAELVDVVRQDINLDR